MAIIKEAAKTVVVINDPKTGKSYQKEISKEERANFIGRKVGSEIDGGVIGLVGYKLVITGGTDKDGFPIYKELELNGRKRLLLSYGPCFRPKRKDLRKRRLVRGNVIDVDIAQINCKVIKYGEKPLEEIFPKKEKEEKQQ